MSPFNLTQALAGRAVVYRAAGVDPIIARVVQQEMFGDVLTFVKIGTNPPVMLTQSISSTLFHPPVIQRGWINVWRNVEAQGSPWMAGNRIYTSQALAAEARPTAKQVEITWASE